jgi:monofunctional biosynthetic peptidoglycan transglycosylase
VLGLGALAVVLATALYAGWRAVTWPDVAALAKQNPTTTAFIERFKAQRRSAGASDRVAWAWVPYPRISPHLKRAVLVAEDINFFSHDGFDTGELQQALKDAWQEKELPRGASTLTQQLAKNLWLSPSRNPLRKLEEAILTRQLETHLPKRRILELYLNVVELGPGIYGAEAAARHYFGLSAAALGERQAAELAASLPRPSTWHPGVDSRGYTRRVETILRRMGKAEFLWREI